MTDMTEYLAERITCVNGWAGLGVMIAASPCISYVWAIQLQLPNGLWTESGPGVWWWGSTAAALLAFTPRVLYDTCRFAGGAKSLFFKFRGAVKALFLGEEVPEVSSAGD